jgi:hypothetical protein
MEKIKCNNHEVKKGESFKLGSKIVTKGSVNTLVLGSVK